MTSPSNAILPPRVAVLIPCYNEEGAIAKVVGDFRATLPDAIIYVYDNNSADKTVTIARRAGAVVRREGIQGKGNVVRRMFADVDADVYVLVDGDDTYTASAAPSMVARLLQNNMDMVTGVRIGQPGLTYRQGHQLGNRVLTSMVRAVFGRGVSDMLSGYRVFSRRFVKSFPALAAGFEIETELTVHALEMRLPIEEVETIYKQRAVGTASKLRTYSDGWRILWTIVRLIEQERPLQFFGLCGLVLLLAGVGLGIPVVVEFISTGLVPRLPTAVLATGCVLAGFLSTAVGLILEAVAHGRKEIKRLSYLSIPLRYGESDGLALSPGGSRTTAIAAASLPLMQAEP